MYAHGPASRAPLRRGRRSLPASCPCLLLGWEQDLGLRTWSCHSHGCVAVGRWPHLPGFHLEPLGLLGGVGWLPCEKLQVASAALGSSEWVTLLAFPVREMFFPSTTQKLCSLGGGSAGVNRRRVRELCLQTWQMIAEAQSPRNHPA